MEFEYEIKKDGFWYVTTVTLKRDSRFFKVMSAFTLWGAKRNIEYLKKLLMREISPDRIIEKGDI